jgi:hypothetical protein
LPQQISVPKPKGDSMTRVLLNDSRPNSVASSNFDFIFNSVVESEGENGTDEQFLETEVSLNECKVLIENHLNMLQVATKRLDEKGKSGWEC